MSSSLFQCSTPRRIFAACFAITVSALVACSDGSSRQTIQFPTDQDISNALTRQFQQAPDNEKATQLVNLLGGEKGALEYRIHRVISRNGAFEIQYDALLRMGQSGTISLKNLYAEMIPPEALAKLNIEDLSALRAWLDASAAELEKSNPKQAKELRRKLAGLSQCYENAKPQDAVTLLDGIIALLSPARDGWYAEKMQAPDTVLRCLPV